MLIKQKEISNFFSTIKNKEDVNKIEIFKHLNISVQSFLFLRYLIRKRLMEGTEIIKVAELIEVVTQSKLFYHFNNLEYQENDIESQMLDNDADFLEESLGELTQLQYLKYVIELIEMGWINIAQNINLKEIDNPFNLYLYDVYIENDLLHFINEGKIVAKKYNEYEKYNEYFDFLKDQFILIDSYFQYLTVYDNISHTSPRIKKIKEEYESISQQIEKRLEKTTIELPLLKFIEKHNLSKEQEYIIIALLKEEYSKEEFGTLRNENNLKLFLKENKHLEIPYEFISYQLYGEAFSFPQTFLFLKDEILDEINNIKKQNDEIIYNKKNINQFLFKNSIFEVIKNDIQLEDLILSKEILQLVNVIQKSNDTKIIEKMKKWNIKNINHLGIKILLNGYSGTAKTSIAYALGNSLNLPILSLDCSNILSRYVGESESNVKNIFNEYKEIKNKSNISPILLLDEVDQFLSNRTTSIDSSVDKMHNQMQNIFLSEIEKFEGILIATTNLIENLDKAFSRRFNYKITVEKPTKEERYNIWKKKLPKNVQYGTDFDLNILADYELTGGQIDMIIKNTAFEIACNNKDIFILEDFEKFIDDEIKNNLEKNKKMGFLK